MLDTQFTTTPNEIIQIVLAISGAVITVSAAIAIILNGLAKMRAPEERQNKRISSVEKRQDTLENRQDEYEKTSDARFRAVEAAQSRSNEIWRLYMKCMINLMTYELGENNVDKLKKSRDELDTFFVNHYGPSQI